MEILTWFWEKLAGRHTVILLSGCVLVFALILYFTVDRDWVYLQKLAACGQEQSSIACYRQELMPIAHAEGVETAIRLLQKSKKAVPFLYSNCHFPIAHELGTIGYKQFGDFQQAIEAGSDPYLCTGGYQHGVLAEFVKQQRITDGLGGSTPCDALANTFSAQDPERVRNIIWQCYHGLGHGAMEIRDYNLPLSLEYCTGISPKMNLQAACYFGVFMENAFLAEIGYQHGIRPHVLFFRSDDVFFPCTQIADEYKPRCYVVAPMQHLYSFASGVDFRNFLNDPFSTCSKAPREYRNSCARGVGTVVVYLSVWDPQKIVEHCLGGEIFDDRASCIAGAAGHYTIFPHEKVKRNPKNFCANVPSEYKSQCFGSIKEMTLDDDIEN